jgi:hypothetical protein
LPAHGRGLPARLGRRLRAQRLPARTGRCAIGRLHRSDQSYRTQRVNVATRSIHERKEYL